MQRDPYRMLGLSRDASREEIRRAYRGLARRHHPDINPQDPEAEERFKELQKAYATLTNSGRRDEHDRGYRSPSREAPTESRRVRTGRDALMMDLAGLLGRLNGSFSTNTHQSRGVVKEDLSWVLRLLGIGDPASPARDGKVSVKVAFGPACYSGSRGETGSAAGSFLSKVPKPPKPPEWLR